MERTRTFLAAIGTACLMLMAVESIRQTDNLSRVVNWIEQHVKHEAKYRNQAEQLSRQLKEIER